MKKQENILYSHVKYGSNINIDTKRVNIGDHSWFRYINLHKTRSQYCIITCDTCECLKFFPNTHMFGSAMTDKRGFKLCDKVQLSGIIVLML